MFDRMTKLAVCCILFTASSADAAEPTTPDVESKYLANIHQVTHGLPRAGEGYFSPDGKTLVSRAKDATINVWDASKPLPTATAARNALLTPPLHALQVLWSSR